jgi:hypothetical protein
MQCDELIRELAVPTSERDSVAVQAHLATCSVCAAWARRAGQFDRLWDMTRPAEPSSEVWDNVWSQMVCSLERPAPVEFRPLSLSETHASATRGMAEVSGARKRNFIGLIGLAEAAAVLLGVGLAWSLSTTSSEALVAEVKVSPPAPHQPDGPGRGGVQTVGGVIEIDEGRTVVIHVMGTGANVVDLTPQIASYKLQDGLRNLESPLVDDWLLMLNEAESMTKPLVAMKE